MFQPLRGVRIVDLTVVWAGPYGTMLLADLGAEVIKVENVHLWQPMTRGLMARPPQMMMGAGPAWASGYPDLVPGDRPWNRSPTFVNNYRNKASVTMDLRIAEGRQPFEDLIRTADVVYENNVTETLDKLGIGYDYLRALRPDIIFVRVPAYGSTGPYRNFRALGVHLEGVAGHNLLRRYPDLDPSTNSQIFAGDFFAGTHGAFATLAALHHRERTGEGQLVEIPQAEVAAGMMAQFMMDYSLNGREGEAIGNRDYQGAAPTGVYPCRGDDRWLALTVCDDGAWAALCAVLGRADWAADPRFATEEDRRAGHDQLDALVAAETRDRDAWELTRALQGHGVAAGPVMDGRDAFQDEHLRARGMFQRVYQVDCGDREWVGPYIRTEDGPLPVRRPPVALGEDNEPVYKDLLGYSAEAYDALLAAGHIGDRFDAAIP